MKYEQPYGITDPNASYINGNPAAGIEGSIPPAAVFEYPQRELVNLITEAGFTPADIDLYQVTRAVRQGDNYVQATAPSGANTYYASLSPTLDQYRAGLRLFVTIPITNTGPSTLNVDGLGVRTIVRGNGAATAAGDLPGGMCVELIDDGTRFQIANYQGFTSSTTNNNNFLVDLPYVADTGTVNALVGVYSPAQTALTEGMALLIKLAHTITGSATMQANSLAAKPIVHPDGTPLLNGDAVAGAILWLAYDGNNYQLVNFVPPVRPLMHAAIDYYVNASTGNDSNTGLDAAHAFQTIQRALNQVLYWDNGGYGMNFHIAAGTYNGHISLPRITGGGAVTLIGDNTNPQNVVIHEGIASGVSVGYYILQGLHIENPDSDATQGHGINAQTTGSQINIVNIEFGFCYGSHIFANGGAIGMFGPVDGFSGAFIRIVGNGNSHVETSDYGTIDSHLPTLIIANAVAFNKFLYCVMGAINELYGTITNPGNVVSGQKYYVHMGGIAHTGMGNSCPGTAAGYVGFGYYD
jgi:hypothetical protein